MDMNFLSSEGCGAVRCGFNHKSDVLQHLLLFPWARHTNKKNSIQASVPCSNFLCLEDQNMSMASGTATTMFVSMHHGMTPIF